MADAALPTRDRVEGYFKELNNWGRWGHDDQLGTVNLITPAKQEQAQRLIKKGRTVSPARDVIPRPVYMYPLLSKLAGIPPVDRAISWGYGTRSARGEIRLPGSAVPISQGPASPAWR